MYQHAAHWIIGHVKVFWFHLSIPRAKILTVYFTKAYTKKINRWSLKKNNNNKHFYLKQNQHQQICSKYSTGKYKMKKKKTNATPDICWGHMCWCMVMYREYLAHTEFKRQKDLLYMTKMEDLWSIQKPVSRACKSVLSSSLYWYIPLENAVPENCFLK